MHHYDVVDFDVLSYWGAHRAWVPGEELRPVRCYAGYDRQLTLFSFPGELFAITDGLTRQRAKYCQLVGNLFENEELVEQLRQAETG